jgi:Tfp pilus assembly protein PilN
MRAVNLIPEDARRGGGAGSGGRSGGAVYVLLGGLAVVVALVAAWAFVGHTVSHDKAELAAVKAQIAQAQAQAPAQTSQQVQGSSIDERLATVRALVTAREDWARTLDAIARTLPANTTLSSLAAATTPTASPGGAAAATGGIASSSTGPSIQIAGCAPTQKAVAQLMPRLRVIPGVQDVSLASSTKAAAGDATGTTGGCADVDFEMVLFLQAAAPPPASPATATAAAAPVPTPTPTPTPGATQ